MASWTASAESSSERLLQNTTLPTTTGIPVGGILTSNFTTLVPTSAPLSPLTPPSSATTPTSTGGSSSNHVFTFFVMFVMIALLLWIMWTRYRRTQEQRRMDYRSAQADRVLGDMQMVPNTDLDLENELL